LFAFGATLLGLYEFLLARLLSRASLRLDAKAREEAFRLALRAAIIGGVRGPIPACPWVERLPRLIEGRKYTFMFKKL